MNLKKLLILAAGAFVLFALLAGIDRYSLSSQLHSTQAQLDAVADSAQAAALRAESEAANAELARQRAREAERVRDSIRVTKIHPRLAELRVARASSASAVQVAPDTCAPVIAALEADVAATAQLAAGYLEAYNVEIAAHEDTKHALEKASSGLADAQKSLAALKVATNAIELPRRSWLAGVIPQAGVGVAAGITPEGKFATVAGLTLGWRVSL